MSRDSLEIRAFMEAQPNHTIKAYDKFKVEEMLGTMPTGQAALIVFWHGVGDLLMFLPVFCNLRERFPQLKIDLGIQPGVGHLELWPDAVELWEKDFTVDHAYAFVINFPMVEGGNKMTKAEYCSRFEIGHEPHDLNLPHVSAIDNRLVGVHFQGTCLPGSTNPSPEIAEKIWKDLLAEGYVPFDMHFVHNFHNPVNVPLPWASRNCRDLVPSLTLLRSLIGSCFAFIGVASGPFVLAACMSPNRAIYLQKGHDASCYFHNFSNIIDLQKYDEKERDKMLNMLAKMSIIETHSKFSVINNKECSCGKDGCNG